MPQNCESFPNPLWANAMGGQGLPGASNAADVDYARCGTIIPATEDTVAKAICWIEKNLLTKLAPADLAGGATGNVLAKNAAGAYVPTDLALLITGNPAINAWLLDRIDNPAEIAAIEAALAASPNFAAIVNQVADLAAIAKKGCAALVAIPAPTKVLAYGADCTEFGAAVVTKRELGVFTGGADFAAHGSLPTGINLPAGRYIIRARFRGVLSGTTVGGVGETIFEVSAGTYLEYNAHSSYFTAGAVNYGHTIETVILVDLATPADVKVILKGSAAGEGPGITISGNANVTAFEIPKYMVTLGV